MPYCQFCGKKLEEGEICACETAQTASTPPEQPEQAQRQQNPAVPSAESKGSIVFKKFKLFLSTYISNPSQAVYSVAAEDYDLSIPVLLTVMRLLSMGLAIYGLLRKTCEDVFSLITTTLLRYGGSANILTASLTAPLPKSLIYGALIAALGMVLFIAAVFVLSKIQHSDITILYVFKVSAANGVLTTALLLMSFLLSFASVGLCELFMVLALLSWVICGVLTAQLVCTDYTSGSFWLLYFVCAVLVFVIGYYVFPTFFLQAAGGITASYMGETVTLQAAFDEFTKTMKNVFAEEGVSDFTEFLRKSFQNIFEELAMEIGDTMY